MIKLYFGWYNDINSNRNSIINIKLNNDNNNKNDNNINSDKIEKYKSDCISVPYKEF